MCRRETVQGEMFISRFFFFFFNGWLIDKGWVHPNLKSQSLSTQLHVWRWTFFGGSSQHFWSLTAKQCWEHVLKGENKKSAQKQHEMTMRSQIRFEKTLFTPSTWSRARAPTSDGVCTNTFSSAAIVKIWAQINLRSFMLSFNCPRLLQVIRKMLQHFLLWSSRNVL